MLFSLLVNGNEEKKKKLGKDIIVFDLNAGKTYNALSSF